MKLYSANPAHWNGRYATTELNLLALYEQAQAHRTHVRSVSLVE